MGTLKMTSRSALVITTILAILFLAYFLLSPRPVAVTKTLAPTKPSLSFSPSTLKLTKDNEATITVTLDQDEHFAIGATLVLIYDPSKIRVTQLKNDTLFPITLSTAKILGGKAEISVVTPPTSKGETTAGNVATFGIRALSNDSSTIIFGEDTLVAATDLEGNIIKSKGILKIN